MPRRMLNVRLWILVAVTALTGCVHGNGCLLTQPVKHTLNGRIHFRSFPSRDGIDNVPILVLDSTAYVYAPAHAFQCIAATELQLVGVAEFPENVIEDSHVSVNGRLFESTTDHQHTRFIMSVITLLPIGPAAAPQ